MERAPDQQWRNVELNKGGPVELELVVHTAHLTVGCNSIGQTIADKHICI